MTVFGKAAAAQEINAPDGPAIPVLPDPRRESRQSLRLQGICECTNPPRRIACTIIDITASGAQLEFESTDPIPDTFMLHLSAVSIAMKCSVKWRKETQLGVKHVIHSSV